MKATGTGLVCEGCGEGTEVIDSRAGDRCIRRRRKCKGCGTRYTTQEVRVEDAGHLAASQKILAAYEGLTEARQKLVEGLLIELGAA